MTDRKPFSITDFLEGVGPRQFRAQVLEMLNHEADLRERLGLLEISQRILDTPALKSAANSICKLPRDAARREFEAILGRIERLEQEIESRMQIARQPGHLPQNTH